MKWCDFNFVGGNIRWHSALVKNEKKFRWDYGWEVGAPTKKVLWGYAGLTADDWPINRPDPAWYLHCTKPLVNRLQHSPLPLYRLYYWSTLCTCTIQRPGWVYIMDHSSLYSTQNVYLTYCYISHSSLPARFGHVNRCSAAGDLWSDGRWCLVSSIRV